MAKWRRWQYRVKAFLARIAAGCLLLATGPLLIVLGILIRLDSSGPALFTQQRVGRNGSRFWIFKLRTMVQDADKLLDSAGEPIADRTTRIGRFLRRSSLDELPQLWNILRGEMAIVGPRPLMPEYMHRCSECPERLEVLPGITGLAQVMGRNMLPWSQRIALDKHYVQHYSLWLDATILWKTAAVVLGAHGVALDRTPSKVDDLAPADTVDHTYSAGRREPVLHGKYAKNPAYESFLSSLNDVLSTAHDESLVDAPEEYATIHVIGAPRSGTTLATQVLASSLDVGYVNNLTAAFWRAPVFGLMLAQKLMPEGRPTAYHSDFGRTSGLTEPHEFGYFWTEILGYPEMCQQEDSFDETIDWDRFRRVLTNLSAAAGKPMIFKSFLLAWHLPSVLQAMPKSVFVWMRRDPVDTAASILKARRQQLGSEARWIGVKPREYEWLQHESPEMQVAGQVWFVEQAIERSVALAGDSLIVTPYSRLLAEPGRVVDKVQRLTACAELSESIPSSFSIPSRSGSREQRARIEAAFASLRLGQRAA